MKGNQSQSQNPSPREKPKRKSKAPEFKPMRAIAPKINAGEKVWQEIVNAIKAKEKKIKSEVNKC